jgi:Iron-sulfur cluster binding domain of dihydroorotate dehydrogenase B
MGHYRGRVIEIRLEKGRHMEPLVACPAGAIPHAGQYLLASDLDDPEAVLGTPLFAVEKSKQGFWATPLSPATWGPGTNLDLVGPLGHGFDLPRNIQRLGLVALGETVSRLMPLVHQTAQTHAGMTLFTDLTLPMLPTALEVSPLASLKEALDWPDFMALDVPLTRLAELRSVLGPLDVSNGAGLPCPAQVLVTTPTPCAGMAQCGACAVPALRGWKLACEDGPVFDLNLLKW